jgi:cytochrome c-type biogenesis protein CcmH
MRSPGRLLLPALIAAGVLVPAASRAQVAAESSSVVQGWDDTQAQRLFGKLMSPFCPGLTLAQCPSPGADSLRNDIRARLAAGEKPAAITTAYAADWGEQMLGTPPVRDWGVLLWTLPGILLLAGAVALALWLRTLRRSAAEMLEEQAAGSRSAESAAPPEPALRRRLDEELEAFEKRL